MTAITNENEQAVALAGLRVEGKTFAKSPPTPEAQTRAKKLQEERLKRIPPGDVLARMLETKKTVISQSDIDAANDAIHADLQDNGRETRVPPISGKKERKGTNKTAFDKAEQSTALEIKLIEGKALTGTDKDFVTDQLRIVIQRSPQLNEIFNNLNSSDQNTLIDSLMTDLQFRVKAGELLQTTVDSMRKIDNSEVNRMQQAIDNARLAEQLKEKQRDAKQREVDQQKTRAEEFDAVKNPTGYKVKELEQIDQQIIDLNSPIGTVGSIAQLQDEVRQKKIDLEDAKKGTIGPLPVPGAPAGTHIHMYQNAQEKKAAEESAKVEVRAAEASVTEAKARKTELEKARAKWEQDKQDAENKKLALEGEKDSFELERQNLERTTLDRRADLERFYEAREQQYAQALENLPYNAAESLLEERLEESIRLLDEKLAEEEKKAKEAPDKAIAEQLRTRYYIERTETLTERNKRESRADRKARIKREKEAWKEYKKNNPTGKLLRRDFVEPLGKIRELHIVLIKQDARKLLSSDGPRSIMKEMLLKDPSCCDLTPPPPKLKKDVQEKLDDDEFMQAHSADVVTSILQKYWTKEVGGKFYPNDMRYLGDRYGVEVLTQGIQKRDEYAQALEQFVGQDVMLLPPLERRDALRQKFGPSFGTLLYWILTGSKWGWEKLTTP